MIHVSIGANVDTVPGRVKSDRKAHLRLSYACRPSRSTALRLHAFAPDGAINSPAHPTPPRAGSSPPGPQPG